jgi:hypothetical protein
MRWVLLSLLAAGVVATGASAQGTLTANIQRNATLVSSQAVSLKVSVRCPSGAEVLEAFVYIVQDGNQSQFAGIPVVCDGSTQRFTVTVNAFPETPFHVGPAQASGFVLLLSGESISPTRQINVR